MGSRHRGWRVVVMRDGAVSSRSLRLRDPRVIFPSLLVLGLLAAGFAAIGYAWQSRQESARIAELEKQLEASATQSQQLRQLAARLERAESNYRELQRIVGSEPAESEQTRLPALPAGAVEGAPTESAEPADTRHPTSWPVVRRGFVTRAFESDPGGALGEHHGVDIAIPSGSYVRASGGGVVSAAGNDSVYGLFVRLEHDDGLQSLYAHNSWLFVAEGDSVEQNEVLALSGNTGQSSAPHLHFEIQKDGKALDPAVFITGSR